MISPNVAKLKLPRNMNKMHSVFNVELFSADIGRELPIVKRLLICRQRSRQIEWLVKWNGLPEDGCTWEREKAIRQV
ncbi:hypothetical protein DD238_004195 [Peronospora effusa]|uniref:Chromo domain-containing protein n=1 Tax=Peronospora effusa TaxID=542832 RepID=A0A3M6VGV1_9STRA|nr:hypothetical protein DD238_004195 [Peronospora effusa]RQM13501.1 hypothetical protein DD237_003784 [Peronospora effusa]